MDSDLISKVRKKNLEKGRKKMENYRSQTTLTTIKRVTKNAKWIRSGLRSNKVVLCEQTCQSYVRSIVVGFKWENLHSKEIRLKQHIFWLAHSWKEFWGSNSWRSRHWGHELHEGFNLLSEKRSSALEICCLWWKPWQHLNHVSIQCVVQYIQMFCHG